MLIQNLNIGKVCFVSDAVAVGLVGDTVTVGEAVDDEVAVGDSSVAVAVGIRVIVGVDVASGGGGEAEKNLHANTSNKIMPIIMRIAYFRSTDENMAAVLLNGVTSGGLPVKPKGDKRFLKLSS